jgi:hypothetical protein
MNSDPSKHPSPLAEIEKEGDAARVALARELARRAFTNPSLISGATLRRLGDRGLPSFLDELGKNWSEAAGSVGDRSQSGSSPDSLSTTGTAMVPLDRKQKDTPSKNNERAAGDDQNLHAGQAVAKAPQLPRPPHNIEGWAHLRVWKLSPKGAGIALGLIVGLTLILIGFLVPAVRPF